MAMINENMDKSSKESLALSANIIAENGKGKDLQKIATALLTELEDLLSLVVDSQSGTSPTLNTKGVDVSVSKKGGAEALVKDSAGSNTNCIEETAKIANKILEENGSGSTVKEYLLIAKKAVDALQKGFDSKKVTPESLLEDKNVQAFIGGLSGQKKPSGSSKENNYTDAIFNLALDVQNLLSEMMNNQNNTNKLMDESSEFQQKNSTDLIAVKLQDMTKQVQDQQKAGQQPWYMYLIAGVLAVAGAVLAAFTAGIAAGVVALVIGGIMGSPLGSMITNALVTAMVGPNPTDAQKEGATAGAIAIIAVVTTILTCGAAGFVTGGAAAAEGAGEEIGEEAAEEGVKKGLSFSAKAFTSGLAERAGGNFIQGFVGGGGASDAIEAIMLATPGGSTWLKSEVGAIVMGIITAVMAIIGAIAGGQMASGGVTERSDSLEKMGMKEVLKISDSLRGLKTAAEVAQFTGNAANGGVGVSNFLNINDLSKVEAEIGNVTANITLSDSSNKSIQSLQTSLSNSSNDQQKVLQNAISTLLNAILTEGKNQVSATTK